MKKIALWGYGDYGRGLLSRIRTYRADEFEVVMIFDRQYRKITEETGIEIYDPDRIAEYYRRGMFDSAAVGIFDAKTATALSAVLKEAGIPEEKIVFSAPFADLETFTGLPVPWLKEQIPRYRCRVLSEMYLERVSFLPSGFIFSEDGKVLKDHFREYVRRQERYVREYIPDINKPVVSLPGEWCFLAELYSSNYAHFTYEILDRIYVLEEAGYTGKYILPHTAFAESLLGLFFDLKDRVVWADDLSADMLYRFEKLVCIFADDTSGSAGVLLKAVRTKLRLPETDREYPGKIYVKRIGRRKLLVSDSFFEKKGFTVIVPEELPVEDQIRYFMHADIVISPHGANCANSLYMREHSVLIETFPMNYVNCFWLQTLKKGSVYYLPCVESDEGIAYDPADKHRDYHVQEDLLEMMIGQAEILVSEG
ncbi:MAG: DUF563 domain-containing protein [Solobacterium sp.]|nr:DUF563 domain-containing protein [Solobacterium sp.]